MIDILESRRLLAGVSIVAGKLRIEGTAGNDSYSVVRFSRAQGQVIDNHTATAVLTFNLASVRLIAFAGLAGDDLITVGRVPINSFLNGGDGNDSLSSSQGLQEDQLLGGLGRDYLFAGDRTDLLDGGVGGDTMLAGADDDVIKILSDNTGDDFVSGGAGNDVVDARGYNKAVVLELGNGDPNQTITDDTILNDVEIFIGSPFNDKLSIVSGRPMRIDGWGGNDTITGGRGRDTLTGGSGQDQIFAAGGDDALFGRDSEIDTLNGGSGTDAYTSDANDVLVDVETAAG